MTRGESAAEYFRQGYNCSESVVLAFADRIGLDRETACKVSVGLGGGVGRLREVCGAVTGMSVVIGLLYGTDDPDSKNTVYPMVQEIGEAFREMWGTLNCRELLKGISVQDGPYAEIRNAAYYEKRPCEHIVRRMAELMDRYISEKEGETEQ